ncbi:LmbE family N-acetylglucosaminyl deacetylase [Bacillus sp. SLBN-46]|uniref:leucine-rich repeat domain-containing protein n=1 Tax=Bacillus sp. SLBN-46 TaxID=3042283 RepID=UPI0028619C8F|nr:leucine-rich repeat domain-containing protein [Bacillus sp. SLBN-46]MDR6121034.1 LmbE family N-acetylglucosaminyl deacetylase [Bacillus sp. SLBN-46]
MNKIRTLFSILILFTSFHFFQQAASAQTVGQKPVAIYYSPHQDDELLSMGMSIATSVAKGYEVHVVLMTDGGGATGALNDVNKKLTKENYPTITKADFINARTDEFMRSSVALGVKAENIHLMNFTDGQLSYNQARQTIETFEKNYPHAMHRSMSYMDWHPDHAVMGRALNDLYNEHKIRDVRFFVKNVQFSTVPGSSEALKLVTANLPRIKEATAAYRDWSPASKHYSIGYISVPSNFDELEKNPQSRTHMADTTNKPSVRSLGFSSGQAEGPITDANLAAVIKEQLGIRDREITEADIASLTRLDAQGRGISSLEGLQYAVNLQFLALDHNRITDLTPLQGLTKVTDLYLKDNQLENVRPLAGLTNMESLHLDTNRLTDLSPLSSLTKMQVLSFNFNKVASLAPLAGMTNLITISMDSNAFKDLSPLKNKPDLNAVSFLHMDLDLGKGSVNGDILDMLGAQASVYFSNVKVTRSYHTNRMVGISWKMLDSSMDKVEVSINGGIPVTSYNSNYLFGNLNPGQAYKVTISSYTKGNLNFTGEVMISTDTWVSTKGWLLADRDWYYINLSTGNLTTGWLKSGDKWYYLSANGKMFTGWLKWNGKWYYLTSSGAMKTGWLLDGGKWYYIERSGAMKIGWLYYNKKWYYLNSSGAMVTGRVWISGKWYYFNASGSLSR